MTKNDGTVEAEATVYEIGYLLVPAIAPERLPEEAARMRELVVKHGGNVIAEEDPKQRDLAYPMQKSIAHKRETFSTAYFGWVKFDLDKEQIEVLKKELDKDEHVIRFLLIETVRENTLASRRPQGDGRRRREGKGEAMSDEEIEKTIEALVAE